MVLKHFSVLGLRIDSGYYLIFLDLEKFKSKIHFLECLITNVVGGLFCESKVKIILFWKK